MKTVYLAIGSNLNNPIQQCRLAIENLRRMHGCILMNVAPFYHNPAVGRKAMPDYINTVLKIKTRHPPLVLLRLLQSIENKQGRARRTRWGARTLDIDIIFYDNLTMRHPQLTIPHPRYHDRDFVLIPLEYLFTQGE